MKTIFQILDEARLNEAHIGDLKNVRYIRHYTTLNALKQIINDGYIEARESTGDDDWYGYDIGASAVVSFHDARTDPEIEFLSNANDRQTTLLRTNTLGIHMNEICCFIEYNFDLLPEKIQKCADFIKILEHYIPEFTRLWNELCEIKDIAIKYKSDNYESLLKCLKDNNEFEIYNSIGFVCNTLTNSEKNIFFNVITRKNLKTYSKSDEKALLNASIQDNKKEVFKILKQHGWKNGDENLEYFYRLSFDAYNTFVDYLKKRFLKTNNEKINIEIRIAHDMPINVRGCTIHFFKGVADEVEAMGDGAISRYNDFIKQLTLMPNVEIYKPGDDYSLIMQ